VLSFAYSIILTRFDSSAAYYLSPSRAWQLSLGAIIALTSADLECLRSKWLWPAFAWAGLLAIFASFFLIDSEITYPGAIAALPTIGAGLLIIGGHRPNLLTTRLLSLAAMLFVGRISYSLYLWHWPLIALFRHYSMGDDPSFAQGLAIIGIAGFLSILSFYVVETPVRRSHLRLPVTYAAFAIACLAVAAPAAWIIANQGLAGRLPQQYQNMSGLDEMWRWQCRLSGNDPSFRDLKCWFGADWSNAKSHAVLWGDSNAEHYAPLLDAIGRKTGMAIVLIRSCPPFVDHKSLKFARYGENYSLRCARTRSDAIAWLNTHPEVDVVVMASSWPGFMTTLFEESPGDLSPDAASDAMVSGFRRFFEAAASPHRSFVLLGEVPHLPKNIVSCAQSGHSGLWRATCPFISEFIENDGLSKHLRTQALLRRTAEGRSDVKVFPMIDRLCSGTRCRVREQGEFLYRDEGHLRRNLPEGLRDIFINRIGLAAVFK
jgi:hypothetical protein